ncbi:MAG: glycoside hydrolase family 3 N-terminal domain-containing protein [Treponema sp.]
MFKNISGSRLITAAVFFCTVPFLAAQVPAVPAAAAAPLQKLTGQLNLHEKAAQVLMVNIPGSKTVSTRIAEAFKGCVPGAVLLFGYNMADTPEAVRSFLDSGYTAFQEAAEKTGHLFIPPLYALDNEGGLVYRTRRITAPLPAAEEIGTRFSVDQTRRLSLLLGQQMKELGLHLNLAPVAEPQTAENAAVLSTRNYSADPGRAAAYAAAAVQGMQEGGVSAAVKHFPGNGSADLHEKRAELTVDRETLLRRYGAPFRPAFETGAAAVLVSHITVPALEAVPFCFSAQGIELLRKDVGFSGLVITDDIAMKALQESGTAAENAVRAIAAGCDMVMCSVQQIYPLIAAIAEKAAADSAFAKRLDEAVLQVLKAKVRAGIIDAAGAYILHHPDWERFRQAKAEAARLVKQHE